MSTFGDIFGLSWILLGRAIYNPSSLPILPYLQILDIELLASSHALLTRLLGQIVSFSGTRNLYKISIDLSTYTPIRYEYFLPTQRVFLIDAINATSSNKQWMFQPYYGTSSIYNKYQTTNYSLDNAPSLTYSFYVNEPTRFDMHYELWGYGYSVTPVTIYFNGSPISITLGNPSYPDSPTWKQLLTDIIIEEPGLYSFTVYSETNNQILLNQWAIISSEYTITNNRTAYSSTPGPFTIGTRARETIYGYPGDITDPSVQQVTAWLSSLKMNSSGKYNFFLKGDETSKGISFTDGVSIESWQVGGATDNLAAWNFSFISNLDSAGNHYISTDQGQTLFGY